MTTGLGSIRFLKNSNGQMTIFIALIFQVLFVFFAMIINVGLIVHDKINLQNSVDLAAYYGAQKQAEMLNAIAHHNYQLRQAWKLLAFRIRVLGDLGFKEHPLQKDSAANLRDVAAYSSGSGRSSHLPFVCVGNGLWGSNENLCYTSDLRVPEIPSVVVTAPFLPFNIMVANNIEDIKEDSTQGCERVSTRNFEIATRWALAYRVQVAYIKKSLRAYAAQLGAAPSDFKDIRGESVAGGTLKTLSANLTQPNRDGMKTDTVFKFYNSLGTGDYKQWLHEIPTYPYIFYSRLRGSSSRCTGDVIVINGTGRTNLPDGYQSSTEVDVARNEPNPGDLMASTFGVEKNPWMMAYVGVYAESKPRKPYLPFGKPITIRAKAYAKPFGGRIGPWYYSTWPRSSDKSAGANKVDLLSPEPVDVTLASSLPQSEAETFVPNYSRFPGDKLGLRSRASLGLFREKLFKEYNQRNALSVGFYSATPQGSDALASVKRGSTQYQNVDTTNLELGYEGPWIRDVEAAAVAPDLFDATYYSVDIDANKNYIQNAILAGYVSKQEASYDNGTSLGLNAFKGAEDQLEVLNKLVPISDPKRFYYLKKADHLLTAWAPSGAFQYQFPKIVFGQCDTRVDAAVPGKCAIGGRVGYSVKIVSEDYLRSSDLELGGSGQKGPIKNTPPEGF